MPDELTHHLRRRRMETCAYQPNYVLIPARLLPAPRRLAMLYAAPPFCPHCNGECTENAIYEPMYYVPVALPPASRRAPAKVRKDCYGEERGASVGELNIRSVPKLWTLIFKMTPSLRGARGGDASPCDFSVRLSWRASV